MQKSKLIRLLSILNPEEFKNFLKFLKSPFFNTNKRYVPFYQYLSKYYPDFDSPKLSKELAFKKLFPRKAYSYNVMGNLMSGLATLTEEYLLNLQFQKDTFNKKKTLIRAFGERKDCYPLFQKYNDNLIKEVESKTIQDENHYRDLRALYHDFYYHPITNRQQIDKQTTQKVMDYLDMSYTENKLFYLLEMKARNYLQGEEYALILKIEAIQEKEQFFKQENPICFVYLKILQLQTNIEDEETYDEIKAFFLQHIYDFGKKEKNVILLHLLNYCIRLIKTNRQKYTAKCLELYKIGLSAEMLIENNCMAEVTFSNIVSIGAICQEFDWTKNFILEYQQFLDEEERQSTTVLSLASLNFAQKNYAAVQEGLLGQPFDKPLHNIKAKVLLIRTYFEQFLKDDSYYDLIIAQTYAFEKFIRRNKIISEKNAMPYLNFIQFTRHLINRIIDRTNMDDLLLAVQSTPALHYRDWFLKKIQDKMSK